MDYRRYALGSYGLAVWVECTACGTPDRPSYVWQGKERSVMVALVINAIMEHELNAHAARPAIQRKIR